MKFEGSFCIPNGTSEGILGFHCLLEGVAELIGAGGRLAVALDATHTGDNVCGLLAFDEGGDALCIAMASAEELNILDHVVVVQFDVDEAGTGAAGLIIDFFHIRWFCCWFF